MKQAIGRSPILGILGLLLVTGLGCGQKHLHVATTSGGAGAEEGLEAKTDGASADLAGLEGGGVEESELGNQAASLSSDATEPIMFAHEPSSPPSETGEPSESQPERGGLSDSDSSLGLGPGEEIPPSTEPGQEIQTQSSSETGMEPAGESPPAGLSESAEPLFRDGDNPLIAFNEPNLDAAQSDGTNGNAIEGMMEEPGGVLGDEGTAGLAGTLPDDGTGEPVERIPDSLTVAKAEPSESVQQQLDRLREEEMATLSAGLQDVFFEFDSWVITEEGKAALEQTVDWLANRPSVGLVIQGHCDDRGTQAYNMVLGKKRAAAIRDYLTELGVDPSKLSVISFGKDKPFCTDPTEVCYQLNRRGHLVVQKSQP